MPRSALTLLLTLVVALAAGAPSAHALPPTDPDADWIADGTVETMARDGQTLYLGGDFDRLNRRTGAAIRFASSTAQVDGPEFDGAVFASLSDGAGGFYVGGSFRHVDGTPSPSVVHLLADGSIDPGFRAPAFNSNVSALERAGDRLYVGGGFTNVGGQQRRHLAALDAGTGSLDPEFRPGVQSFGEAINDIAVAGDTVYVVGNFGCAGAIGGTSTCGDAAGEAVRRSAAAFDGGDGELMAWAPNPGGAVSAIELTANATALLGGSFTCVNTPDADCTDNDAGQVVRRGFAEVNGVTGVATSFTFDAGKPGSQPSVRDLLLEPGGQLTVAGAFTCVYWNGDGDCSDGGEVARQRVARLSATRTLTAWAPAVADGGVSDVVRASGGSYWLGGDFVTVGGAQRDGLAVVHETTAAVVNANAHLNEQPRTLAAGTDHVLVGGGFTGAGGLARRNLAAIDLRTGQPTGFDPAPNHDVAALAVDGGRLYAGGDFTTIASAARKHLVAFDLATGALADWAPEPSSWVSAVAAGGGRVYAAGDFAGIGGDPDQPRLASLDAATGAADPAFPAGDSGVNALALADGRLYVGGFFSEIGGQDRDHLAAIDLATGTVSDWAPEADAEVHALAVADDRLYVAGAFGTIADADRYGIAALDRSGAVLPWDAGLYSGDAVHDVDVAGGVVAIGGALTELGGAPADSDVALLRASDASALPWDPKVSSNVRAVEYAPGAVYAGGSFTEAGPWAQEGLATFTAPPASTAPPAVTGDPVPGGALACDPGAWEGNPALATSWLLGGGAAGDGPSFAVGDQHVGGVLSCRVSAANVRGEAAADSPGVTVAGRAGGGETRPAGTPRLTLTAAGRGVRRTRAGRYVVRYGSSLRLAGTLTGADGAPAAGASVALARTGAKVATVTADARGRFALTVRRPARGLRVVARAQGAEARLRADVAAALRSTTRRAQSGPRVRIAGRIALPRLKRAGRLVVSGGGRRLATLRVRRTGAFAATVARRARYTVRFLPPKGSGLVASSLRVSVRR